MKLRSWQWWVAAVALELAAGAATLAGYRAKALAASELNWSAALNEKPEGEKADGVSGD